jgi:hypothetical protein
MTLFAVMHDLPFLLARSSQHNCLMRALPFVGKILSIILFAVTRALPFVGEMLTA